MQRGRPRLLSAPALLLLGCSTLAEPQDGKSCQDDAGCPVGEGCNNGVCYPSQLPPKDGIALDIRSEELSDQPAYRIELVGSDPTLARILDGRPNRYSARLEQWTYGSGEPIPGARDRLEFVVTERRAVAVEGEPIELTRPSSLILRERSRIGRADLVAGIGSLLRFPGGDGDFDPAVQPWPFDGRGQEFRDRLLIEISPDDDADDPEDDTDMAFRRGLVYRQLVRENRKVEGAHDFDLRTIRECHRPISSKLRFPDGQPPLPPVGPEDTLVAGVAMRHAGRRSDDGLVCDPDPKPDTPAICSPSTIEPALKQTCTGASWCPPGYGCYDAPSGDGKLCGCMSDAECPAGQVCNLELQACALDLTDLPANKPGQTVALVDGDPIRTAVYTYCDDDPEVGREMEFSITASPDVRTGLPRLNYRAVLDFPWEEGAQPPINMKPICLPTWPPAQTIDLELLGAPAEIHAGSPVSWVCCSTDCLHEEGATPSAEEDCKNKVRAAIGVTGLFKLTVEQQAQWTAADCMPLQDDPSAGVRVAYNSGSCPADETGPCRVALSSGVPGDGGLDYDLRIEPPVGSIFRSDTVPLHVDAGTTEASYELKYRVLLRGAVTLESPDLCKDSNEADDKPADCTPRAEILAERIVRPEDPTDPPPPGPYLFTTTTLPAYPGEYVLPVNPGVYLVTALPQLGVDDLFAGPADITVIDLREDSPNVRKDGELLVADLDLVLRAGATYTVELFDFDLSSRIIPLDLVSWVQRLKFEGNFLDLSRAGDEGTCYPKTEGCQIRRLRPGNRPAQLTQEGLLKYTTRRLAD